MGDFDFDIEFLKSLVKTGPLLWDKTDGVYKDKNETKKAWTEVCICLQEDFEALGGDKKGFWLILPYLNEHSYLKFTQNYIF